ncbi:unnamed protein product [Phytomonas sp. Hart1]|nr:unnamed protein product [Phytomonas sp. Hart1]|eukprot:CCW67416.1 unnamed protein product [Phytomonas sp. isolate Hart1]
MLDTKQPDTADIISLEKAEIGDAGEKKTDSTATIPTLTADLPEVVDQASSNAELDLSKSDACSGDNSSNDHNAGDVDDEQGSDPEDEATDTDDDDFGAAEVFPSPRNPKDAGRALVIKNRPYPPSSWVHNQGYTAAQGRLAGNPKASFGLCAVARPHNILRCGALHLNNRGILIGDRYVRLHMLRDGAGKTALLENPGRALKMECCQEGHEDAATTTCTKLHLVPNLVFIGVPGLRTAYYENELHQNLAFTRLKQQSLEVQCGAWCRTKRSHVITTCPFLHYQRGSAYTEKPKPPSRPLALIPDLTPKYPTKATITAKSLEYGIPLPVIAGKDDSHKKTKKHRGRGGNYPIPLPEFVRGHRRNNKDGVSPPTVENYQPNPLVHTTKTDPVSELHDTQAYLEENKEIQENRSSLLMMLLILLVILFLLLVYTVKKPFDL